MSEQKKALTVVGKIKVQLQSEEMKKAMQLIAPEGFKVDIHVVNALNTVKNNLKDCKNLVPASVLNAVYVASSLGLNLNPQSKEAYLVPFNSKIGNDTCGTMVTFIPGYKGLQKLCINAGMKSMTSKVIYEKDSFSFNEMDGEVTYSYSPTFAKDRGDAICVLTVATMQDGTKDIKVLPYHKVLKIKNAAKSQGGPWSKFEEEMAMKTAIRRHCNQLPQSFSNPDLAKAISIDEMCDAGKPSFETPAGMEGIVDADYEDVLKAAESTNEPVSSKPVVSMPVVEETTENGVVIKLKKEKKSNITLLTEMTGLKADVLTLKIKDEFSISDINAASDKDFSKVFDFFANGLHEENK